MRHRHLILTVLATKAAHVSAQCTYQCCVVGGSSGHALVCDDVASADDCSTDEGGALFQSCANAKRVLIRGEDIDASELEVRTPDHFWTNVVNTANGINPEDTDDADAGGDDNTKRDEEAATNIAQRDLGDYWDSVKDFFNGTDDEPKKPAAQPRDIPDDAEVDARDCGDQHEPIKRQHEDNDGYFDYGSAQSGNSARDETSADDAAFLPKREPDDQDYSGLNGREESYEGFTALTERDGDNDPDQQVLQAREAEPEPAPEPEAEPEPCGGDSPIPDYIDKIRRRLSSGGMFAAWTS